MILIEERRAGRQSVSGRLVGADVAVDGHGVTPQEVAISAMVNWRASYIR
jgi:hypothetical protein